MPISFTRVVRDMQEQEPSGRPLLILIICWFCIFVLPLIKIFFE